MIHCPSEIWADCLHFFGKDVYAMDGGEAVELATHIFSVTPTDTNTGKPVGAVARFWYERQKVQQEERVMTAEEIMTLPQA